ncbi:MAG: hypothetical protein D3925_11785 [Candidatus Electrothrix sp. AR5]|nr:hypothetical protein [Candidatus Electrothrix sp. AR5]
MSCPPGQEHGGKINAKHREVQADFLSERGRFERKGIDFLIKDLGEDELGDVYIAHQGFENNVVYRLVASWYVVENRKFSLCGTIKYNAHCTR